jgi:hypothetical protein
MYNILDGRSEDKIPRMGYIWEEVKVVVMFGYLSTNPCMTPPFLNSAQLCPGKKPLGTHWIRDWMGPRVSLDAV